MGSNCAQTIDVTHERRPTTTETQVAHDNSTWHVMNTMYINSTNWGCLLGGVDVRCIHCMPGGDRWLEFLLLWACVQCHVWCQLFERNYFPLFVDFFKSRMWFSLVTWWGTCVMLLSIGRLIMYCCIYWCTRWQTLLDEEWGLFCFCRPDCFNLKKNSRVI